MHSSEAPAYAFPGSVLASQVGYEMVLLDLRREQYYGLDEVAALIVTQLTQTPRRSVMTALHEAFEVPAEVLERDVQRLVHQLLEAGLLTCLEPS